MLDRLRKSTYLSILNKLPIDKRVQIFNLLVEGNSLRATSRIADVSINTVTKLFVEVGQACQLFHDDTVRGVDAKRVQADEIWSFAYSKEKNKPQDVEGVGDAWTFVGIDSDSKLVITWLLGNSDAETATFFMRDIAERIKGKIQLTTDGLNAYIKAVDAAFPTDEEIDFAQLVKTYGPETGTSSTEHKYSPAECTGCKKTVIYRQPDEEFISTSHIERQNLTMRMHMRRFTRLTNGFSKKIENHGYAVALHFVFYNFTKIHKTLRVTPAMQAGIAKRVMTIEDICNLIPEPVAQKRGSYKKKGDISK
jgi:IS1 family transposase